MSTADSSPALPGSPADSSPAPWSPGRAELFAACVPVVMLLTIVVLALCGFGDHGSRVAVGLDAPDVPTVVAAAPVVPVAPIEEDSPLWDCRTMGNRVCGVLAPAGGPTLTTTGTGGVRVACPTGGTLVDVATGRGCAY